MTELPIEGVLPRLKQTLAEYSAVVLSAPPGAGKTTRVPLALLEEAWLAGRRMLLLEPRRLAARAAAHRMASQLGERIGGTVGYRMRLETSVGPSTRIEVVTEGVLTRLLHADPALDGVGAVLFDEFHERSLHADLGLALCLQVRDLLRPDLRLLVMSATLDVEPVRELLGGAPLVESAGRAHPVGIRYLERRADGPQEPLIERVIRDALERDDGDVLVFLPGTAEIRRMEERLASGGLPPSVRVAPLFGDLPLAAQQLAILPSPAGQRKVVLATSIAETSLTIEGVRVVVDGGRMRVPRFSPRTGMSRLATVPVSRASAEQRCGRAGRVGPGVCYRLWTEPEQLGLVPYGRPEILDADLAPLVLELAAWGVRDPGELRWLDPPPAPAYVQARELLIQLGALEETGSITPHGRQIAGFGTHPRLGHMLLRGAEVGLGRLACRLAALLSERDPLRGPGGEVDADIRLRLELLQRERPTSRATHRVDGGALRRVQEAARRLEARLGVREGNDDADAAGLLVGFAYPDRIARRRPRGQGRFLLRNGRGAVLDGAQPLVAAEFLAIAELAGHGRESLIYLAAPLDEGELREHFADQIRREDSVAWDSGAGAVRARSRERLGAIVLSEGPLPEPDEQAVADALLAGIRQEGLQVLRWTAAARQLQQRIAFLHRLDDSWPDVSDHALTDTLEEWLGPVLIGFRRRSELQALDLERLLSGVLTNRQRTDLPRLAPTHLTVPSGSRVPIDYGDPAAPAIAVRLQELFGLAETPRIGGGAVPLTFRLLSPAHRPVQVTRDLASFWRSGYFEVRKSLRGRYPKHYWPDDPLQAAPTRRTRPAS